MSSRALSIAFYGVDVECAGGLGVTPGSTMDFQGVAKVLKKQGFFINLFAKVAHEAKEKDGKLLFPFRITGTMEKPKFEMTE
jgi:hypothetical protein